MLIADDKMSKFIHLKLSLKSLIRYIKDEIYSVFLFQFVSTFDNIPMMGDGLPQENNNNYNVNHPPPPPYQGPQTLHSQTPQVS